MLAHRRADVDDLNRRARDHLLAAGALAGPAVYGADLRENPRCFAVGDQVDLCAATTTATAWSTVNAAG